jgi:hypothetical protein
MFEFRWGLGCFVCIFITAVALIFISLLKIVGKISYALSPILVSGVVPQDRQGQ